MSDVVRFGDAVYVKVSQRVSAFRKDFGAELGIETEALNINEAGALFKAVIKNSAGQILSVGHRFISSGEIDCITTAETQAIGRALTFFGYGSEDLAENLTKISDCADAPATVKADGKSTEADSLARRLSAGQSPTFKATLITRGKE